MQRIAALKRFYGFRTDISCKSAETNAHADAESTAAQTTYAWEPITSDVRINIIGDLLSSFLVLYQSKVYSVPSFVLIVSLAHKYESDWQC